MGELLPSKNTTINTKIFRELRNLNTSYNPESHEILEETRTASF